MRILAGIRRLYQEWQRNYHPRGGLPGLAAGLAGSLRLRWQARHPASTADSHGLLEEAGIDIVTFSVVPELTRLWARFLIPALADIDSRILIGDCSGGLGSPAAHSKPLRVIPIFNHLHGIKLDLFMNTLCRAPVVVISDDDIFWLSRRPLSWALEQIACRPRLAVVSLYPRSTSKPVLVDKLEQPMGSFCLVIRRDIWIREKLSFKCHDPYGTGSYDWTYDTADLAHVELLERGYQVAVAPPEMRARLAPLEGVSNWTLKLQKHDGEMSRLLLTDLRLRKAYRVFRFLEVAPGTLCASHLVAPRPLARGLGWCRSQMSAAALRDVDHEIADLVSRLRARLDAPGTVATGTVATGTVGNGTVGNGTVGNGTVGNGTVGNGHEQAVGHE